MLSEQKKINIFIHSKCKDVSNSNDSSNDFILHCTTRISIRTIKKKTLENKLTLKCFNSNRTKACKGDLSVL